MANTVPHKKVFSRRSVLIAVAVLILIAIAVVVVLQLVGQKGAGLSLAATGNDGGNLANGGTLLESGGKIYLTSAEDGHLLQTSPGKTDGTPVGNLSGRYLNADGSKLWYVDANTGALMRSDLSGGAPAPVVSDRVTRLMRVGDYLYFVDADSSYALSRVNVADGSAVELLSGARVMQYAIVGEKLFYRDLNEQDSISFMDLDGANAAQLMARAGQVFFGQGARLFISNPDREGALDYYELSSDGKYYGPTALDTGTVTCAVADEKTVYYTKAADGKLYAIDIDQSAKGAMGERLLADLPVYGLQCSGDYIYYQSVADGGQWGAVAKK